MKHLAGALVGAVALLSAGCGPKRIGMEVVWPDPPDVARIKFVTAFRSSAELDLSVGGEFARQVLGGSGNVELNQPRGVAVSPDGKRLYITDQAAHAVLVADFEKKSLTAFTKEEELDQPFGVAVDAAENVYVADQRKRGIVVFDKTGTAKLRFGQKEDLLRPTGVAVDPQRGFVYVSDPADVKATEHRVLKYRTDGTFVGSLGKGRGKESGQFNFPMLLDVDAAGNVYVADMMNFRIQVFDPAGQFIQKFGDSGTGPGTFSRIKGIAHDSFGNLYAVDGEHASVQIFNSEFEALMYFGGPIAKLEYMNLPIGIAIDRTSNKIFVVNSAGPPRINVYQLINTSAADSRDASK